MKATLIGWAIFIIMGIVLRKKFTWELDKTLHWCIGWAIPVVVMLLGWFTGKLTDNQTIFIGFALVVVAAAFKEIVIDKWLKLGHCTLADFIFTVTGGFAGTFLFVLPIINAQS